MKTYFYSKKPLLMALIALLFMACQTSTSTAVASPYPYTLKDFKAEWFYGKFVGSNKAAFSRNPADDSLLWNDCYEFTAPATVSLTNFVEYDWRSPVFKHRTTGNNGVRDVFFPTMLSNNTAAYITNGYFVLRYDITDNQLDLRKDGNEYVYDNWGPTIDSDLISGIRSTLSGFMDRDGTLAGQTVFQIVYFQTNINSIKGDRLEEIEFNFGSTLEFVKTTDLQLSGNALRKKYEEIAASLIEKTKTNLVAFQSGFWIIYRRTTADFNANSIPEFQDNSTKTCPR